jgi:hypothetical protein
VPLRAWLGAKCRPKRVMERVAHREAVGCVLGGVYGAQELHELVIDLGRGFVLYPVAHIIDFEREGRRGVFRRVDRAPPSHPPSPQ